MPGIYGISSKGRYVEDWLEPFYFTGTLTDADVGKAVSVDTSAEKTVKLAADGDEILGRLETVENRVQEGIQVCTVALKFFGWLPKTGAAIALGNGVQGAGGGLVKALATGNTRSAKVFHIDNTLNRVFVVFQ